MEYKIEGGSLPVAVCMVHPGEVLISESGAMSWMSPNMHMEATTNGGLGKAVGRMFTGESLFQNRYTSVGGDGLIAFASSFPGSIRAIQITPDHPVVVQKRSFLACEASVSLSVFFQKKIGAGLFGGEGFIMQKLSGNGTALIEIDGSAMEYTLGPGQQMIVDTGYLAMMDASCSMEVVTVPGVKNMLFGGEGVFHTVVKGPGRIVLQSMPASKFAASVAPYVHVNKS